MCAKQVARNSVGNSVRKVIKKPVTYSFILPDGVKYRITLTKQIGTYKFDENFNAERVKIQDALEHIGKYKDELETVKIGVGANLVETEDIARKKKILEKLHDIVTLKCMGSLNRSIFENVVKQFDKQEKEAEKLQHSLAEVASRGSKKDSVSAMDFLRSLDDDADDAADNNETVKNKKAGVRKEKSTTDWLKTIRATKDALVNKALSEDMQERLKEDARDTVKKDMST